MNKDSEEAISFGHNAIIVWGGSFLLLGAIAIGVHAWAFPHLQDAETKGLEHSYTYVQTKKELLITLVQQYKQVESQQALNKGDPDVVSTLEGQKKAIVNRMRSEAGLLRPEEVPDMVRPYL